MWEHEVRDAVAVKTESAAAETEWMLKNQPQFVTSNKNKN